MNVKHFYAARKAFLHAFMRHNNPDSIFDETDCAINAVNRERIYKKREKDAFVVGFLAFLSDIDNIKELYRQHGEDAVMKTWLVDKKLVLTGDEDMIDDVLYRVGLKVAK
jgi:hypothetical protein